MSTSRRRSTMTDSSRRKPRKTPLTDRLLVSKKDTKIASYKTAMRRAKGELEGHTTEVIEFKDKNGKIVSPEEAAKLIINAKPKKKKGVFTPRTEPSVVGPAKFDSQGKVPTGKKRKNETQEVTPPPPLPEDDTPTLHTMRVDQIIRTLIGSPRKPDQVLGAHLNKIIDPFEVIGEVRVNRTASQLIFDRAGLRTFNVSRLSTVSGMSWIARIGFLGKMKQIDQMYRLHMVLDPTDHFRQLDKIDEQEQKILQQPSMLEEFNDDNLNGIRDQRETEDKDFLKLLLNCPDMIFDLEVKESKYTDTGWTIIAFKISPESVNMLNDRREYLKYYKVLLTAIEQ